jgi:hypothetical protein
MFRRDELIFVMILMLIAFTSALDVSFIPNDENAPLPLSAKYRESLRRLCTILKSGSKLPPELIHKKKVLKSMCAKLDKDDRNIAAGAVRLGDLWKSKHLQKLFYGIISIFGGYFIWANRLVVFEVIRKVFARGKKQYGRRLGDGDGEEIIDMQVAREARLKRFAAMNIEKID